MYDIYIYNTIYNTHTQVRALEQLGASACTPGAHCLNVYVKNMYRYRSVLQRGAVCCTVVHCGAVC